LKKQQSLKENKHLKFDINIEKFLPVITGIFFIYSVYIVLLSENNIQAIFQKLQVKESLEKDVKALKEENRLLSNQKYYLETDPFYIEKKAREDLGLAMDNEEIYVIVDKSQIKKNDNSEQKTEERWIDKIIKLYKAVRE